MMNFEKEILAKMAEGKTLNEIAAEFTDALNAAEKVNDLQNKKVADTQTLLNAITKYINEYYPEVELEGMSDETTAEEARAAIKILDGIFNFKLPKNAPSDELFGDLFASFFGN